MSQYGIDRDIPNSYREIPADFTEGTATWDEGRWWTPAESAEFVRQLAAEMGEA